MEKFIASLCSEFFFQLSPRNSSPVSRFSVVASCSESSMAVSSFGGSRSFTLFIMRGFRFQVKAWAVGWLATTKMGVK